MSRAPPSSLIGEYNNHDEVGMRSAAMIVASSSPIKSSSSTTRGRRPSFSSSSTSIAVLSRNSSLANSSTSSSLNSSSHYQTLSEQNLQQYEIENIYQPNNNQRGFVSKWPSYSREVPYENQQIVSNTSPLYNRSNNNTSEYKNNPENMDVHEAQRLKVERMFQSAIKKSSKTSSPQKPLSRRIYATEKYKMSDTEDEENSEISSISTGLSDSPYEVQSDYNVDEISPQPTQKIIYNLEDSVESNIDEIGGEDLQILIPKSSVKSSRNSSLIRDSVQNIDITPIPEEPELETDNDLFSMIEANRVLKHALDDVTKEKNDLEEQFVTQVEELEKFLTRSQRPYVKKGRRSLSRHLSDEEMSNVNSALRTDIPSAEDSPIVKLSQSLLSSANPNKFNESSMSSSEKDSVIYSLREKIEEIKYRYENERATESVREALTSEIGSLLEKLTVESDGSQTERTRNLTSSLKNFLDSSSLSVNSAKNESKILKELRIESEIQKGMIEKLKSETEKLKEKLESERKSRKIISKELSQSESYILRLEDQMQKKELQNNEKLLIVTRAYDDIVAENSELIQQVKFLREQLLDNNSSANSSVLSGRSNKNKLTSSNIISMISDTHSVSSLSSSRNDEPVKDIK